ncbi:MAG: DNA polymerase III subunit beta [Acidimicrobiales bacterium]
MKLRCERDTLVEALSATGRAAVVSAGRGSTIGAVHLSLSGDDLQLTSNDGDLTIRVEIVVAGSEDGACLLPSRLTGDIVRALEPGAVVVENDDEEAHISAGRSQFGVRLLPELDFPRMPASEGTPVDLGTSDFAEALHQVVRAASTDEARPTLNGVLLAAQPQGLRMVATDSYRLAERTLLGRTVLAQGQEVSVPARALVELQRLASATSGPACKIAGDSTERELSFSVGEYYATFHVGDVTLTTTLLRDFPNVARLFSQSFPNQLSVGKEPLLEAIRRVRLLARDATSWLHVSLEPDQIQLMATDQERGHASEDVDAKYDGEEMTMQFNPAYLIDGVDGVCGDEVLIEIEGPSKPVMVHASTNDPYRYLLAPRSV